MPGRVLWMGSMWVGMGIGTQVAKQVGTLCDMDGYRNPNLIVPGRVCP